MGQGFGVIYKKKGFKYAEKEKLLLDFRFCTLVTKASASGFMYHKYQKENASFGQSTSTSNVIVESKLYNKQLIL